MAPCPGQRRVHPSSLSWSMLRPQTPFAAPCCWITGFRTLLLKWLSGAGEREPGLWSHSLLGRILSHSLWNLSEPRLQAWSPSESPYSASLPGYPPQTLKTDPEVERQCNTGRTEHSLPVHLSWQTGSHPELLNNTLSPSQVVCTLDFRLLLRLSYSGLHRMPLPFLPMVCSPLLPGLRHVLLPIMKAAGGFVQPGHTNTQAPLCYILAKEEQSWLEIWDSCPQAHVSTHLPVRSHRATGSPRNTDRG